MTTDTELRALELAQHIVANKQGGALGDLAEAVLSLSKEKAELERQLAEYEAVIVSSRLKQDTGYERAYLRAIQKRAAESHASRQSGG